MVKKGVEKFSKPYKKFENVPYRAGKIFKTVEKCKIIFMVQKINFHKFAVYLR